MVSQRPVVVIFITVLLYNDEPGRQVLGLSQKPWHHTEGLGLDPEGLVTH